MNNSSSSSISALVPGGVVTTQNISTVIKPKENNNSMQFVKIQTPELSKKAEEQIRVAQESKITKDKIKEVEEEWQSNLLNWKSKRRQQFVGTHSNDNQDEQNNNQNDGNENGRKIKTFAEMIEERSKTGNRLNFHLERYIGSSESDNYESEQDYLDKADIVEKEFSQLSLNGSDNNHSIHRQHRSISHNNNPSSLDYNELSNGVIKDQSSSNNFFTNSNVDLKRVSVTNNGNVSHDHVDHDENDADDDEDETNFSHTKPLNSTFKQGIDQPPTPPNIHSDDRIRPTLEVDTKTREVSSTPRFEDNASDHDEDEDEQEEEQKHLQRIAFVAKLKAFEKMTKPSMQEPKFVAPKLTKAPPPLPLTPSQSNHIPSSHVSLSPQAQPSMLTPPIRQRQFNSQSNPKADKTQETEMSKNAKTEVQASPRPTQLANREKEIPSPHPVGQMKQQNQAVPTPLKQQILSPSTMPTSPPIQPVRKQPPPPIPANQLSPTTSSSLQQQPPPSQVLPPTVAQQSATVPQALKSPIPPLSPPRHQYIQPPQQAPPRHQSQQQQPQLPIKDDKAQDRTVLSVSGKKRCSSCKEELGRGAAAFVIESLNLVYHTNCFRCSVCHANLSNGFRGVDVRVHAGALHCQNCYSKDGLNYSRV